MTRCLVELANRMMESVSHIGTVCRYGGEEFAIILPNVPLFKAAKFADLLRKKISQQLFDLSGVEGAPATLPIQVSIGVSATDPQNPNHHGSADQLIQEADKAVYAAKDNGRNCVRVFGGRREGEKDASWDWPEKPSPEQPPTPLTRVLIVEPDPFAARLLRDHFSSNKGTQVTWTFTYAEATEFILQSQKDGQPRWNLVTCELNLPDGDGTEIVQIAKQAGARVMVVTTKTHADRTAEALSCGADETFFKEDLVADFPAWSRQILEAIRANSSAA